MKFRRLMEFGGAAGASFSPRRFAHRARIYLKFWLQFCSQLRRTNKKPDEIADYR
jgi:hypothetical protein